MRKINRIIIHHSESPGGGIDFLRYVHVERFGWRDVGYHYVIGNGLSHGEWTAAEDGEVQNGRPINEIGAHAGGSNHDSVGICLIGNCMKTDPTEKQISALTELCLDLCKTYKLEPAVAIMGHGDVCNTDCPGERMKAYLPALRYILKGYLMIDRLIR